MAGAWGGTGAGRGYVWGLSGLGNAASGLIILTYVGCLGPGRVFGVLLEAVWWLLLGKGRGCELLGLVTCSSLSIVLGGCLELMWSF